jgi:hypothetical protein
MKQIFSPFQQYECFEVDGVDVLGTRVHHRAGQRGQTCGVGIRDENQEVKRPQALHNTNQQNTN